MDDETRQLEDELKNLQPVAPSRRLAERIEAELASTSSRRPPAQVRWFRAAAFPAAAVIALALAQLSRAPANRSNPGGSSTPPRVPPVTASSEAPFKPIAAIKVLVSADDEGLVTLDDGTQARRERLHYIDTITWKNPRTNASLKWSVPREEVRVVPIAFQ